MSIPYILLIITIVGGLVGFVLLSFPSFNCEADAKKALSGAKKADRLDCNSWEGRIRPYSEDFVRKALRKHGYSNVEITHYWLRKSRIVVKL